jgi:hypothetical protein
VNHRGAVDTKSGGNCNQSNGNDILSGGSIGSSFHKSVFDKDFPSLGGDERPGSAEIGRVASPGLGATASQSLPVGSSPMIGGEGWTSALAEVPSMMGSSSTGSLTVQQTVTPTSGSVLSSTSAGLNMAEALVQTPSRSQSIPQVVKLTLCLSLFLFFFLFYYHFCKYNDFIFYYDQLIMCISILGFGQNPEARRTCY